jgi:hypothetical protein
MSYLLYTNGTATTGRRLRQLLNIPGGTNPPDDRVDWLIRWGASARVARRPRNVFNTRGGILRAVDKTEALKTFSERGVLPLSFH